MLINQSNKQITTQGVILHLLICHLPVFSEKNFFTFFTDVITKMELRTP